LKVQLDWLDERRLSESTRLRINNILRIIGETVISLLTIKYARILHRKLI